jgi:chemotaxis signal transduction protein
MNARSTNEPHALPSEWREEWSRELAQPLVTKAATDIATVLVFRIGAEWFSLPAASVVEISHVPAIHRVPHRQHAGVVNVRGRVTVCVDLPALLEPLTGAAATDERLVVLQHRDWVFAAKVDAVDGVHRLESHAVEPPPPPADSHRFVSGLWTLAGRSVACLDAQKLFTAAKESLA